ncbi:Maturase K [Trichuris trichiura]|uniref:Maturase K n=1 Tax=Trichuris trichiura TaxID=36087 RepID=A0A077ZPS5_TRITR|nr:Maturase K [Trichuris trichiura]
MELLFGSLALSGGSLFVLSGPDALRVSPLSLRHVALLSFGAQQDMAPGMVGHYPTHQAFPLKAYPTKAPVLALSSSLELLCGFKV